MPALGHGCAPEALHWRVPLPHPGPGPECTPRGAGGPQQRRPQQALPGAGPAPYHTPTALRPNTNKGN